jgi:hypothetical protein
MLTAGNEVQQGSRSRARRPENGDDLTIVNRQIDALDYLCAIRSTLGDVA